MNIPRRRIGVFQNALRLLIGLVALWHTRTFWASFQLSWLSNPGETVIASSPAHEAHLKQDQQQQQQQQTQLLQLTPPCHSIDPSSSCALPPWMQNYFQWHTQQLANISNASDWMTLRLLVVRCLSEDRCGGTADRLKGLPVYLAIAAQTKRLLFLRWTRPFPLESFLLPYQLNWTIPDALDQLLLLNHEADSGGTKNGRTRSRKRRTQFEKLVRLAKDPRVWLVEGVVQLSGGDGLFEKVFQELGGASSSLTSPGRPSEFFHDMFLALFRPAPNLRRMVEMNMQILNLRPNQFVTAHIRAKYPGEPYRETWNTTILKISVIHALDCASSLAPTLPVYVAGDAVRALEVAQDYGRHRTSSYPIVSLLDIDGLPREDPPHLNFATRENPSAFFSIFADLILMSQSRCVAFGAGGFGRFGSLASFNSSCQIAHSGHGVLNDCTTASSGAASLKQINNA